MKTVSKILLFMLGFPLMVVLVVLESLYGIKNGSSYGLMAYVGVIVASALMIVFLIITLITWGASRKAKTVKTIRICTAVMVVFSVVLTTGVWFAIDNILPPILSKATDATIEFEDIVENYKDKSDEHRALLDTFIVMNVKNGNLTKLKEAYFANTAEADRLKGNDLNAYLTEQYQAEGYKNEEVKNLISMHYNSMFHDGYDTFKGPWLNLANDSRLTIPAVVHLIINEREIKERHIFMMGGKELAEGVNWTILDMTPDAISIQLPDIIASALFRGIIQDNKANILKYLNAAIEDPELAGAPINIGINFKDHDDGTSTASLDITNSDEVRGVHDYMRMAWFNSNGLLVMVISLFPTRHIIYVFGGIIAVLSLAIGIIREKQYKGKCKGNTKASTPSGNLSKAYETRGIKYQNKVIVEDAETTPYYNDDKQSPYLKAYYESLADFNRSLKK